MKKTTFIQDGNFYKGNIHTHTTRSDGRLPPEVVISEYRKRGYNFLILTEHNRYTDLKGYDSGNFILLPGMEINPPPDIHAIRDYHSQGKSAGKWPLRYLIRHTAFHTMDHAWEMEDKDLTGKN